MTLKYSFFNDYSEGAHPQLLRLLAECNLSQQTGYGEDEYCLHAAELIRQQAASPQAGVHFLSGGTQANLIALAAMLKPYQAVIAAASAHINVHEAGAVEATGHKIVFSESADGKLTPAQIEALDALHGDEHMVRPKVVFLSNSTEVGTIYRKGELQAIAEVCRRRGLYLYLDGARLGSALTSDECDLSLAELAGLVDAFYIGGTKNGALFGEAMVIVNPALQPDFRYYLKQHGALLAKGRALGVQFVGLFENGLYFELARHANRLAGKLAEGIRSQGFDFLSQSSTNQIFPILPNGLIERMQRDYGFYVWAQRGAGQIGGPAGHLLGHAGRQGGSVFG